MAVLRDRPYVQFNFLVDLGTGDPTVPDAGFQEVSRLDAAVDVIEYRTGNSKENAPMKITGLTRVDDVVLRRGVIGSLSLAAWSQQVRDGDPAAARTVTISLQNEDRTGIVMSWKLLRARPVRHVFGPLDALGGDVAVEELVLAYERLEVE